MRTELEFCLSCEEWPGRHPLPSPKKLVSRKFRRQRNAIWIEYNVKSQLESGKNPLVLPMHDIYQFSGLDENEVRDLVCWINETHNKIKVKIE